ncbi:MAG TPA: hypothetical protein VFA57_12150 [Pseudolabrys sp.]|jgi:hypothetical protein|nr:hypothetical protein [Pseudolabrys sp.]
MNQDPTAKSSAKKTNPTKIVLLGAVATALALFNMMGGGEAPSFAVRVLEYVFLACGLIALAGGLLLLATRD